MKGDRRGEEKMLFMCLALSVSRPFEFVIFISLLVFYFFSIIPRAYPWNRNWNRAHFLPRPEAFASEISWNFVCPRMTPRAALSGMKTVARNERQQLANVFTLISRSSPISLADSFLFSIQLNDLLSSARNYFRRCCSRTHMSLVSSKNIREVCRKKKRSWIMRN